MVSEVAEVRRQIPAYAGTEVRRQRSEDRGQRSEDKGQRRGIVIVSPPLCISVHRCSAGDTIWIS